MAFRLFQRFDKDSVLKCLDKPTGCAVKRCRENDRQREKETERQRDRETEKRKKHFGLKVNVELKEQNKR